MSTSHTTQRTTPSLPGKRATNLSLSSDVLDAAKQLGINLSQVRDNHLREVVRLEQERKWREEHADFITAYNVTVDTEGLPLDESQNEFCLVPPPSKALSSTPNEQTV